MPSNQCGRDFKGCLEVFACYLPLVRIFAFVASRLTHSDIPIPATLVRHTSRSTSMSARASPKVEKFSIYNYHALALVKKFLKINRLARKTAHSCSQPAGFAKTALCDPQRAIFDGISVIKAMFDLLGVDFDLSWCYAEFDVLDQIEALFDAGEGFSTCS